MHNTLESEAADVFNSTPNADAQLLAEGPHLESASTINHNANPINEMQRQKTMKAVYMQNKAEDKYLNKR